MPNISTRYKVAIGYIVLMSLLIVTMVYIYHGLSRITGNDDYDSRLGMRRRITNELLNTLNKAEIIGQSIAVGQVSDYSGYKNAISVANGYIDSLRNVTDDSLQLARIDTVASLMVQKEKNMRTLMGILSSNAADDIYRNEIEAIIALQDSLAGIQHPHERILVHTKSEVVATKPKNFFKRVREVFVPSKKDSTVVNDTIYEIYTDTIKESVHIADTISSILREMQLRASDNQRERFNRLNSQMQRLNISSLQLNGKVQQLLKIIEDEDRRRIEKEHAENEEVRAESAVMISIIAVVSLLLAGLFLFFIWRDIARSNHYRRELEKAKMRAEELLEAKEKLMLTITHDIKAPVGAILGYVELLDNITTGERQQFYLKNMQGSADHLLQLVTSLLDFHKLDADKMEQQRVPFNAKELFEGIADNNAPVAVAAGLALSGNVDSSLDTVFMGDPLRIRQITENLLSNAIKFTSEGRVTLTAAWLDGYLRFSVSDTGCGMTLEEQELIYKEFMRLPSAQGKDGFGLGLAITSKLVKLLGGEITVESCVGKGTSFHVSLPLECTGSVKEKDTEEASPVSIVRPAELLLIDDDRLQLDMTAAMLDGTPVKVTCCTHPDELFLHLQQKRFDILFTDIQMPAMNGIDLIGKVREFGLKDLPVVATTARSDMEYGQLSFYGFAACLHKPFTCREMLEVISGLLPGNGFDFGQLTAFAAGDADAMAQIMDTFISETGKKRDALEKAMKEKDIAAVTMITHQLLPIFAMVGASEGKDELEWFEARRDADEYPAGADEKIALILEVAGRIIAGAGLYK